MRIFLRMKLRRLRSGIPLLIPLLWRKVRVIGNIQVGDSVLLEMDYGLLDDVGLQNRVLRSMGRDSIYFLFNETWQRNYPAGLVKGLQRLQAGDSAHVIVPYGMPTGQGVQPGK